MGARRTEMHRLQELVRLHRMGVSSRRIGRQLSMGRDTIRCYLRALRRGGILTGAPDSLPELPEILACVDQQSPSALPAQQTSSVEPWLGRVRDLRQRAGPKAIHDHLRLNEPGYRGSLSAIKRLCLRLEREEGPRPEDVAIPVETAAGEVAQVDFVYAGKRYDPQRGVLRKCWLFVMTLCFSRRMYCELVFDQKVETWLALHIAAFEHFGGVPRVIVPDNLKAAVVRCAFGPSEDPALHRSYRELAQHYGFQIDPTPPRSPEKKGKVERSGRYIKGGFLSTWETVDIHADNRALRRWNAEVADVRVHATTKRRPVDLFEEQERGALLPLPGARWERVMWKTARLHSDSHVQIDGAFYSAPWRWLHQDLWVRCTAASVSIHAEHLCLCSHARVPRGRRSTVPEHLPEHRVDLRERSKEHWVEQARRIAPEVEALVLAIFAADDVLLRLRPVQAVMRLLRGVPPRRARAAAARALRFGCLEYVAIKNILAKGLDLEPLEEEPERAWSAGSRFARRPAESLFAHQEQIHVHH